MDQRLKKWIKWLRVCKNEIQDLLIYRDIFWNVQKLIKKNKAIQKPSRFYGYFGDTYISYVVIAIRRQVKIDKQSISFARLLKEISENPKHISRKYFTDLYKGSNVEEKADSDFNEISVDENDFISPDMVNKDFLLLKKTAQKIEDFADKKIAHRDKRQLKTILTFKDVDDCIDVLAKLYMKYHLIFHGSALISLKPTYQYDWMAIFDEPWRTSYK